MRFCLSQPKIAQRQKVPVYRNRPTSVQRKHPRKHNKGHKKSKKKKISVRLLFGCAHLGTQIIPSSLLPPRTRPFGWSFSFQFSVQLGAKRERESTKWGKWGLFLRSLPPPSPSQLVRFALGAFHSEHANFIECCNRDRTERYSTLKRLCHIPLLLPD